MKNVTNFLRSVTEKLKSDDAKFEMYMDMRNHPGWDIHKDLLKIMLGLIVEQIVSQDFSDLDPETKDVMQRSYANTTHIIRFLMNPTENMQKVRDIAKHNQDMLKMTQK